MSEGLFLRGDIVKYGNREIEISYWPADNEGFANFVEHIPDGASHTTTDHVANLISRFTLIRHGDEADEPALPAVEAGPVAEPEAPAAPAKK